MSGYEKQDVAIRNFAIWGFAGIVLLVMIVWALNTYFITRKARQVYEIVLRPESADLRTLKLREHETLHSYKLLDVEKNRYQIPVSRAMELLAEEAYAKQMDLLKN